MPHVGKLVFSLLIVGAELRGQTPTSTSLLASSNPAPYGRPVTLTAIVTSSATGKVTFYDGTTIVGLATLSGTQASLTTVLLASGARKLRAYYQGDGTYAASSSAPLTVTVVAGTSLGFQTPVNTPSALGNLAAIAGDFDGDGRQDLAMCDSENNSVVVYLGAGDGTFQAGVAYPTTNFPYSIVAGDFNGDGKMDLAVTNLDSNLSVLLGNGDGTFQAAVNYPAANAGTLAAGDFNGDGIADLVATNRDANSLTILLGNGDGTFRTGTPAALLGNPMQIFPVGGGAVADFDGDGNADILLTYQGSAAILLGNGDGTFQTERIVASGNIHADSAVTADFNGDGIPDIVVSSSFESGVQVLLGKGDGTFDAPLGAGTLIDVGALVIADFNGDGIEDLVAINNGNSSTYVAILPGNGNGTFGTPIEYTLPAGYTSFGVAADFNGDSDIDLVVVNANGSYTLLLGGALPDLTIAASHGTGLTQGQQGAEFAITVGNAGETASVGLTKVVATLPPGLTAASLGGLNWGCVPATLTCTRSDALAVGAAYPNIILKVNVSSGASGNVTTSFTVSGGGEGNLNNDTATDTTFLRNPTVTTLASSPNPAILGQAVTLTATVTAGATGSVDFYDGVAPLGAAPLAGGQSVLTTAQLSPGAHTLRAQYTGSASYGQSAASGSLIVNPTPDNGLSPYTSNTVDIRPEWVVAGDLNGDGKTDLVTANYGASATGSVSVLIGKGDGAFRSAVTYPIGSGIAYTAAIGDFNNDGKPDIAVAAVGGLFLLAGNGDGSFRAAQLVSTSIAYNALVVADFNGDGNLDLITLNSGSYPPNGIVTLFLGNGDGTFQAAVSLTDSSLRYGCLSAADINGDGIADLVAVLAPSTSGSVLSIFLGNGDGTFQNPVTYPFINDYLQAAVVGDFNGDGKPDVALLYTLEVSVMTGNGDGTLKGPIQTNLAYVPSGFAAAADFDGDGKLDLIFPGDHLDVEFGNGDGTFRSGPPIFPDAGPSFALGDFNGDGMLDLANANGTSNTVDIFLGAQVQGLSVASTHTGRFTAGQGGTYQLTVTNYAYASTSGTVTLADDLPAGFTATAMGGSGWTCTLSSVSCTRADALAFTHSYPSVALTVTLSANLPPSGVVNGASVSLGGILHSAADATMIVAPPTITLSTSASPSTLGQPVTLTATVTAGATGSILILQNGVPVGSATIVGNQASLTTRLLPAGLLSLVATYTGDANYAPGVSAAVYQNTKAAPSTGLGGAATFSTGNGPQAIAAGDFNHDGMVDLVTANSPGNTVSVLLGNGDGTFGANMDYPVAAYPNSLAVADFNNDGQLDIAVSTAGTVAILLGNSNGTFQPAIVTNPNNAYPFYLLASDFNGDGKVDLLMVVSENYGLTLLLGNGDGTFQAGINLIGPGGSAVVGDFNRDGKIDIETPYGLFLGHGDGTFQLAGSSALSGSLAGDMNADGQLDIVNGSNGAVNLGNGDGSFQAALTNSTILFNTLLADLNGDGKLDVAGLGANPNVLSVLTGKGDGTLLPATSLALANQPAALVAGDFNGDGRSDLAIANAGNNNITVLLGSSNPTLTVTSSHSDPFSLGQTGATYTLSVTNNGPAATTGAINLTEVLPYGLTATAMTGTNWNCTLATLTCSRADSLAPGASYPSVTLTVNVTVPWTGSLVSQVGISGPNVNSSSAQDSTSVVGTAITIQTNPPGLQFTFGSGGVQTAPQTMNLTQGQYAVSVATLQLGPPGTQYVFTGWSNGGSAAQTLFIFSTPATYTANFKTQYQLTAAADPIPGGSVTPASSAYYDAGSAVTLVETANSPYLFTAWSTGATSSSLQLTMNSPQSITATFNVPGFTCAITGDTSPSVADLQMIVNESLGTAPAVDDLTHDRVVNVADVQKVADSVLGMGCIY